MSYEQKEVHFVGQIFYGNDELLELLLATNAISQELVDSFSEDLEDGELLTNLLNSSDFLISDFPELHRVDSIGATDEMFLGYIIETKFVGKKAFNKEVEKAQQKWRSIFNEDANLETVIQYI
jgi:hypothetical protein